MLSRCKFTKSFAKQKEKREDFYTSGKIVFSSAPHKGAYNSKKENADFFFFLFFSLVCVCSFFFFFIFFGSFFVFVFFFVICHAICHISCHTIALL